MMNTPAQQMQPHPAQVACEFMTRTDLKGGEVDAYAQTFNWLHAILQGELAVVPTADLQASQKRIEALEKALGPELLAEVPDEPDPSEEGLEPVE